MFGLSRIPCAVILVALLCLAIPGTAGIALAADATPAVPDSPVSKAALPADHPSMPLYTARGAATCMQCHNEAPVTEILKTPHAVKGDIHTPFGQHECESLPWSQ